MKVILASASPRRKEILGNTKLKFNIIKSDIEEVIFQNELPNQAVMRLSFEKCMDISINNQDSLVIGADTVVVYNNEILGKPKDRDDAYNMLKTLSGNTHQVMTGISLIKSDENKKVIDYVVSDVKFKALSDDDINDYLNTNEYIDKAGSYGIQGFGSMLVNEIKGDYFNIVGLPISKLSDLLRLHFNINLFIGDVKTESSM